MVYKRPKIMAILNVTPDSFSDGGKNLAMSQIKETINSMVEFGVDIIDIGAESTRPGAEAISSKEEILRLEHVLPYVKEAVSGTDIKISLDSRHYATLNHFVEFIDLINDVECGNDTRILELVRDYKKQYCFYFSTSVPVDKDKYLPDDTELLSFFCDWIREKMSLYISKGIKKEQLIFDPGICFGLGPKHSFEIIKKVNELDVGDIQILLGYSRKSFLSVSGEQFASKRDPETHAVTSYLVHKKVDYIRVHNFQETHRLLNVLDVLYSD